MKTIQGSQPSVSMGGITLPISKAILLKAMNTVDAGFTTLMRSGSAYQVPSGKKLVIVATRAQCFSVNPSYFSMGYGDNAVSSSATAPTNAVHFSSIPSGGTGTLNALHGYVSPQSTAAYEQATHCEVPADKYPWMRSITGASNTLVECLAYLEDA